MMDVCLLQWYDLDDTEGTDYPGNFAENMDAYDVCIFVEVEYPISFNICTYFST